MVSFEKFQNGIARFVDAEVLPKMTGVKKLGAAAYMGLASQNIASLIRKNIDRPAISVLNAADETGIDIDRLYNALAPYFTEKYDMDVPLLGRFTFGREDLDKLYNYIRE